MTLVNLMVSLCRNGSIPLRYNGDRKSSGDLQKVTQCRYHEFNACSSKEKARKWFNFQFLQALKSNLQSLSIQDKHSKESSMPVAFLADSFHKYPEEASHFQVQQGLN